MYIRCVVAVLDFNANVTRPNKEVDGETVYKMKVNLVTRQAKLCREISLNLGNFLDVDEAGNS